MDKAPQQNNGRSSMKPRPRPATSQALRAELKAKGLCTRCAKQPAVTGKTQCEQCRAYMASSNSARYIARKEQGLCGRCGKSAAPSKSLCERCADKSPKQLSNKEQECPQCHSMFVPYNNRKNAVYCSYACQRVFVAAESKAARRAALKESTCQWCEKMFLPSSSRQAFCSSSCHDRYKNRQLTNARVAAKASIKCFVCGKDFIPLSARGKYCSIPCRYKAHADQAKEKYDPKKQSEAQARYRKKNNESVLKSRLKNWYGMSLEDYKKLLADQNNRCAICGEIMDRPHLDHDHRPNGKVRELLSSTCNTGLGAFRDSPLLLASAILYLRKHGITLEGYGVSSETETQLAKLLEKVLAEAV